MQKGRISFSSMNSWNEMQARICKLKTYVFKTGGKYKTKTRQTLYKTSPLIANSLTNIFEAINCNFIFNYFKDNLVKPSGVRKYILCLISRLNIFILSC